MFSASHRAMHPRITAVLSTIPHEAASVGQHLVMGVKHQASCALPAATALAIAAGCVGSTELRTETGASAEASDPYIWIWLPPEPPGTSPAPEVATPGADVAIVGCEPPPLDAAPEPSAPDAPAPRRPAPRPQLPAWGPTAGGGSEGRFPADMVHSPSTGSWGSGVSPLLGP